MSNQTLAAEGQQYLMNTYGRLPITLVKGQGCHVWDADGQEYLDFVAGIAVNSLGHCHPVVVKAVQEQAATLIHCSNLYWIEPQIKLAKLLVENSCFDKAFFCNSGAEANEGALKLARKYAKQEGHPERYEIITMNNSFHGRTLATLTATGQDKVHHNFDPLPNGFKYVPFNDLAAAEAAITPATAAIMVEPVQGEGGVIPADPAYLQGLRALCDKHGILLIFDEVQVGCGRLGKLFGYQVSGVEPDIITLAKALGGGVAIGAMLCKETCNAFVPGEHGTTFGGNPLATAAGCAAFGYTVEHDLAGHCTKMSAYFVQHLKGLIAKYEAVQDIRGQGLLLGLGCSKPGAVVVAECLAQGLLINCTADTVLRFVPPLTVTETEIDKAVGIVDAALAKAGF